LDKWADKLKPLYHYTMEMFRADIKEYLTPGEGEYDQLYILDKDTEHLKTIVETRYEDFERKYKGDLEDRIKSIFSEFKKELFKSADINILDTLYPEYRDKLEVVASFETDITGPFNDIITEYINRSR
jgi:hypothetical protein